MSDEAMAKVSAELFPKHRIAYWTIPNVKPEDIELFTGEETLEAGKKIKGGKAPGTDGIPPDIIKLVVERFTLESKEALNNALKRGQIPRAFKEARLVLVEKPRKENSTNTTYRPLCMIGGPVGLATRISPWTVNGRRYDEGDRKGGGGPKKELPAQGTLCPGDPGRKNAFNSAPWTGIMGAMRNMSVSDYLNRMIMSYLEERSIAIGDTERFTMSCGVPQGSILGPTLWNIYYDGVLKTNEMKCQWAYTL